MAKKDFEDTHRYDDIMFLPHPDLTDRPRMDLTQRAVIFSPFAALTGFEDRIDEAARIKNEEE